ncbi:Mitochondrial ATP-dependent protease PIM1/LON [Handroanthus impetiginosus]|uniref:Lon protease homolog n=1 Tax=Handroanthus impetiginosus TaxID=429701 RepID=A0A2G9HL57_9LAMI|nr:Mitochondrial ATP-dependent protease PIM1/LON [Handroanthus impetiginosus]
MAESVKLPDRLAILYCGNTVLLPGVLFRIRCASPSSVSLVEQELCQREEKGLIGILPVCDAVAEVPSAGTMPSSGTGTNLGERSSENQKETSDSHKHGSENQQEVIHWHNTGVAAQALQVSIEVEKTSGRVIYLVVFKGLCRFSVRELSKRGPYYTAWITPLDMTKAGKDEVTAADIIEFSRKFKVTAMELISVLEERQKTGGGIEVLPGTVPMCTLADIFVARSESSFEEQVSMLDSVDLKVRFSKATELMRALMEEFGGNDGDDYDVAALERRMQDAGMPADIWKHARRGLRGLKKMQPLQSGYDSLRVYLGFLADLPWQKASEEWELDLKAVKERLDNEHYGLVKVKQQIFEYLAARKLKLDARRPVLCFVGPPGVGKTSFASFIAASLGRKFISISLGVVKDEADIRGHRGTSPGLLIDGLKRVGVCNPVILLDEIDKARSDVRGDPAYALLEVLDPEWNKTFNDCYLNVPFDLSKVIFVATANTVQSIRPPLLDRMEVIEVPGYTPAEKVRIAMRHLIPRVLEQHGLSFDFLQIPEATVKLVIQRYTREAGVCDLERNLAALARAAAVRVAEQDHAVPLSKYVRQLVSPLLDGRLAGEGEMETEVIPSKVDNHDISNAFRVSSPFIVDEAMLEKVLGPPRYGDREAADRVANAGVSIGLVRTLFGGEVQFVQADALVGKGDLHVTGQLGDVIKESAQIALSWVKLSLVWICLFPNIEINLIQGRDIHIHFPAGAVPKDAPSAAVTLVTALVSLFSQRRVRADTAMTGEMTLMGLLLPVGGIIDKVLAACRYGIKRVILPDRNLKDLVQVPSDVLSNLEILPAKRMEDVLEQAFEGGFPLRQHSEF